MPKFVRQSWAKMTRTAMLDAETLETLLKAQRFQAGAWQKVIDCARQYAQMKTFGTYIEHGNVMHVAKSDQQIYID